MNSINNRTTRTGLAFTFILFLLSTLTTFAQTLQMSDFVLFGGNGGTGTTTPASPGYGVQLGSSTTVNGGSVGSLKLVKSTGNSSITGNIYSVGTVVLNNSNTVTGKITAANSPVVSGTILSVGSSANLGGNIDVNGNIVVGGGTVSGIVKHPSSTTYTGPAPAGGNISGTPALPTFPALPAITTFPAFPNMADITSTQTITAGLFDDVKLSGNKTLTFSDTGVYVFDKIENNSGSSNTFVFDFKNHTTGTFRIYVHNNVLLEKLSVSIINGGSANRIYLETHGTGSGGYAFNIANGSSSSHSKWMGTVWAPYAAINIGSGTGNSDVTGAFWSRTQVNIQSGVSIIYAPYQNCSTPNANAGSDKVLTCTTTSLLLSGSSSTSGTTFNWTTSNGTISSGAATATPTVSASGTYILTVTTSSGGCTAKDTAVVTLNNTAPNANAGADKIINCTSLTQVLNGSSTTSGVTFSWNASNGGNISGATNIAAPTASTAGTYTVTVTNPANGCTATDVALITLNNVAPNANAGADKILNCTSPTKTLDGSSTTGGVTFSWSATNGGTISGATNTASPVATTAGTYTVTVTNPANGCTATDVTLVTIDNVAPNANAGADNVISCAFLTRQLNGSSSTSGVTFNWIPTSGGNITSATNIANPTINAVGIYTLTVTNPANGCTATDAAQIFQGPCIFPYYPPDPSGKVSAVIGSELTSLFYNFNPTVSDTLDNIYQIEDDSVYIEVISLAGQYNTLLAMLQTTAYGITDLIDNGNPTLFISGKYPVDHLKKLDSLPIVQYIDYVRPLFPAISNIGVTTSAGDVSLKSDLARAGFNLNGQGITRNVSSRRREGSGAGFPVVARRRVARGSGSPR